MLYRVKITFCFILFFVSCATPSNWYTTRVPNQLRYIERDLALNLEIQHYIPDRQFYLMWNLIKKKDDVGIYLYRKIGPHIPITHAFMYNGDTVFYTNIMDSIGMKVFLESNQFSKRKVKKFNKKLELFKKDNETVNQLW